MTRKRRRRHERPRAASAAVLGMLASLGCLSCLGSQHQVARVVDGQVTEGRFVSHVAYAAYARAAQLEAHEEFEAAEVAYLEALRFDPQSPQILTRLGRVRCSTKPQTAGAAFDAAERLAPDFAPLWYERGRCELAQGHAQVALRAAHRALELDPRHLETSKLIAEASIALGRQAEAARYLDALVAQYPHRARVDQWRHELTLAARDGNAAKQQPPRHSTTRLWEALDRALVREQLPEARALATELGLGPGELAARAVLLGRPRAGLEQARIVSAADPSEGTAWAAALAAADLLGNDAAFVEALAGLAEQPTPPSASGQLLLADVLKRRVGREAAAAWLEAAPAAEVDDSLLRRHRQRLKEELTPARDDASPASESELPARPRQGSTPPSTGLL